MTLTVLLPFQLRGGLDIMVAYSYIYYQTNLFSKNKNVGFVSPKFPINKSSNKLLMFRAMGIIKTLSFGICCSFTLDTHLDQGE